MKAPVCGRGHGDGRGSGLGARTFRGLGEMFDSVMVIGRCRLGSAVAERLRERGIHVREDGGTGLWE